MALLRRDDPFNGHWYNTMFAPPATLFGQEFGNGILHDMEEMTKQMGSMGQNGTSKIQCDKDKYQVMLDVKHFMPEEIHVKTVDNCITVEGRHEEKPDEHGYVIRSFKRRYILPEDVKSETVHCNLSADGVLTLQAPRALALEDKSGERPVPVLQTGAPHYNLRRQEGIRGHHLKKSQCCRLNKEDNCCTPGTP
jgi:crystallin alpha B